MNGSLLVRRVRIVDLDGDSESSSPLVRDVWISDGVIAAVGERLASVPGVEEIDGDGRWAIPGVWDAHVHASQWVRTARMVQLGGSTCAEDALDRLRAPLAGLAGRRGPLHTLFGFGFRSAGWPRQPTVAELDAVSSAIPVVLIAGDAHNGWPNSAAMALLGVPAREGAISEGEWFALLRRLDELPGAVPEPADFIEPVARLAARGVTGLIDFEFADSFVDWPLRMAAGVGPLRVRTATYPHQLDQVIAAGWRTGDPLPGTEGLATMGPLKVITDGSLGSRTAWTHDRYADGPATTEHPCGQANYSVAELTELVRRATSAGLEVALHAIGDRANAAVLDAFAAGGGRGSVEHVQLITTADAQRMAALGLRASVQPAHLVDDRDLTDRLWGDERAARSFPLRGLLDAGVQLALGSDVPVAPLDPWLAMACAVHRSGDDRPAWHPEQALTVREALAASVDERRLRPGSPGDLVLLDADQLAPAESPADAAARLRTMPVALTICAGSVTHALR
ncbi:MAG: amidohydrolase family protein [Micropruina sp.]|uniref:amidohydrolase n=1 Tax=Micropruina sp. TaxID=2737536 RepID=UPI0039E4D34C